MIRLLVNSLKKQYTDLPSQFRSANSARFLLLDAIISSKTNQCSGRLSFIEDIL